MKENKDKILHLRLSASEKEKIKELAKKYDMNVSEFVRYACEKIFLND